MSQHRHWHDTVTGRIRTARLIPLIELKLFSFEPHLMAAAADGDERGGGGGGEDRESENGGDGRLNELII